MIRRVLEFSVRQRGFVLLAAAGVALAGVLAAVKLPIDAVPDITNVQVQINTEVPALAPEETEKLVTFPLETELSGVPGMVELRSLTRFGLSQITLIFEDGADIYRARQLVGERLQGAVEKIPPGLDPKLAPITTGLSEIYQYVVDYGPEATNKPASRRDQLMELKFVQDYLIKPMLRTVPGVAEINAMGGYEKQVVVMPRPEKLRDANVSFDDLAKVIGENVENAGGGVVNQGQDQLIVRAVGRVQTMEQIGQLPVKFGAGLKPILVKDLADVGIGSNVRTGAAVENGEEALIGMAMMLMGENSRVVARRVSERLKEVRERLPAGVVIRTVYDRSQLVDRTIGTVAKNLFEGAVLVVVVLLGLLGNWRAALIVALAIPLSFLFAMTGMAQGKLSGNLMSLGAIDFGLIIDGAVVVVENIVRQLSARQKEFGRELTKEERLQTILNGGAEVGRPMFFGVLIITLVYVPILTLTGIEGKMFHPMAIVVMLCLGAALVVALTVMPALCSLALRARVDGEENVAMRMAKRAYAPGLRVALRHPWWVVIGALGLFVAAVFVYGRLGSVFIPRLNEGSYLAMVFRTNSVSLTASLDMEERTEKALLAKVPEIERVFARIGTSEVATDPMPPSQTDLYIFCKPGNVREKDELAETIGKVIEEAVAGQAVVMSQPIEMRFNELLEGVKSDLAVKIFGADYDVLEKIARDVKAILEKIPGAGEVEFEASGRVPMLDIEVNRSALVNYNLHAAPVNRAIAVAIGGQTVGVLLGDNRRQEIVVRMPEESRAKLDGIRELPVRVGENGLVPLSKVADFKTTTSVDPIQRDSGQRRAAILVSLRGRDVESFVREAEASIQQQVQFPAGYSIEFGGQFKNLRVARARLAVVVPVALALIFVLVFAALGSLRQTLLIYTGVPLAATGGVFALWARGMPFSISAGVGFIALSGVAVLNGLVMISYFNQLRERGRAVPEAVSEGALARLRPVLMTALVAAFGFVPMALATSAGAEVQRPLATVVIGGIISSTFLTLILLPVLYEWVERWRDSVPHVRGP